MTAAIDARHRTGPRWHDMAAGYYHRHDMAAGYYHRHDMAAGFYHRHDMAAGAMREDVKAAIKKTAP